MEKPTLYNLTAQQIMDIFNAGVEAGAESEASREWGMSPAHPSKNELFVVFYYDVDPIFPQNDANQVADHWYQFLLETKNGFC